MDLKHSISTFVKSDIDKMTSFTERRKSLLLLSILWLISFSSFGQDNTLLWRVTRNELSQPSFIFGTIHMLCDADGLSKPVRQAIGSSNRLFLELDLDDPQLQTKIQKWSIDPGMKEFYDQLDRDDRQTIDRFLRENYNADLNQMSVLRPFALMTMILVKRVPCEHFTSMEELILREAKLQKKTISGLETLEFQMGIFNQIPAEDQIGWIMDILDDDYSSEFDSMMEAYKDGDLEELEYLMNDSPGFENYVDIMLYERNRNWIGIMKSEMKKGPTFFAVGAGHLGGGQGVLELLREEGFTVEPVM